MCDHPNSERAMVVIERKDGVPTVWCDPCLAGLIWALNKGGIRTIASCCGHGRQPGSVMLADGRELLVVTAEQRQAICAQFPGINGEPPFARPVAWESIDTITRDDG